MSFFYPKDVDFMEMFGCESHIDNDGLLESTFIDTQNIQIYKQEHILQSTKL